MRPKTHLAAVSDAGELTGDPDLESLRGDPAWPAIVETVRRKAKEKG
jgi:hypothetical protein